MKADTNSLRLVLAGAPLDNDNRGVEALGRSVVDHLQGTGAVARLSLLDGGWGVRPGGEGIERVGVRNSRRVHRRESWTRIRFDQALGGLGNPVARRLRDADALLDISGGDSFTDLYGPQRLTTVCAPKEAAIRARRPLVLLPQTYGPFRTDAGRRRAERIVRSATVAYSRDEWSHDQLLDLAGEAAERGSLRRGVDVAFALTPQEPDPVIATRLDELAAELVVGVNISGLLRTPAAQRRFDLAGDYLATMTALVRSLVSAGAVVLLVPHVHNAVVSAGEDERLGENDATAIQTVVSGLTPTERSRTVLLPPELRAAQLKWCIARTAWFTGTRMHATIAALSSQVPTFGYAYSDKARGVFGTCGIADQTADARRAAGAEAVAMAMASFEARAEVGRTLRDHVPAVVDRAREQLDEVVGTVAALASSQEGTRNR